MNAVRLFLATSLAANVVLAVAAFRRPEVRAWFGAGPTLPAAAPGVEAAPSLSRNAELDPQTWSRIAAGGLTADTVARLKAEGLPPRLVRLLVEYLVHEHFAERRRAIMAQRPPDAWWQRSLFESARDPKTDALRRELEREERDLLAQLLGPNPPLDEVDRERQVRTYGNLPPEKIARLERIDRDYKEMMEDIRAQAGEIILPEDREKLALLESEKQADIAKLLTPEELFEHEVRSSVTARRLREQLALFEPSEAEFRAMFALQNAVEAKYSGGRLQNLTAAERRERNQALRELPAQMQSVLTPERFAAYQLAIDPAYQMTHRFVTEQSLPVATAAQIVALQKDVTTRASTIRSDRVLTPDQRNAQLAALEAETQAKLSAALGDRGLAAYRQGAGSWLNILVPPAPPPPRPAAQP